jgi:hypothetical protein
MKPFDYINRFYGLAIRKGSSVRQPSTGKMGVVHKDEGAHIMILWNGEGKPRGPYHPTYDLEYSEGA